MEKFVLYNNVQGIYIKTTLFRMKIELFMKELESRERIQ